MTPIKELSWRIAVLAALANRIGEANNNAREALMNGLADIGADRAPAVLPNGTKVGSVCVVGGKTTAKVVDETAFLAHVKATRPDEVIEVVRPSYQKMLLAQAAMDGEEVPGVQLRTSSEYLRATFTKGGEDSIAAAWVAGELDFGDLLQLPGAPGDTEPLQAVPDDAPPSPDAT